MNKLFCLAVLPAILACGATVVTGCGGGGNSVFSNQDDVSRFAGTYNGTFQGIVAAGVPGAGQAVSGTFVAVVNSDGGITGSVTQPGVGTFPATGTINKDGKVSIVATITAQQSSTLTGNASKSEGGFTVSGAFATKQGGVTVVNGTFTGSNATAND